MINYFITCVTCTLINYLKNNIFCLQVNLDHSMRAAIYNHIQNADRHSFDSAQRRIQGLMEQDAYGRFLQSDLYKDLTQGNSTNTSSWKTMNVWIHNTHIYTKSIPHELEKHSQNRELFALAPQQMCAILFIASFQRLSQDSIMNIRMGSRVL